MNKTSYTYVAYKSNSEDYCRGCRMGSSPSDMKLGHYLTRDMLIIALAEVIYLNKQKEGFEDLYMLTIMVDGRTVVDENGATVGDAMNEDDYWDSEQYVADAKDVEEIINEARLMADERIARVNRELAELAATDAQKQQDARREQELKQLADLKARYEQ